MGVHETTGQTGNNLPNTASNLYNGLAAGFTLVAFGLALLLTRRAKNA
ncbi:LPXTG cell wall anchor domain-containing protein [Neobacillus niacini]